jgi:hypothetical protein
MYSLKGSSLSYVRSVRRFYAAWAATRSSYFSTAGSSFFRVGHGCRFKTSPRLVLALPSRDASCNRIECPLSPGNWVNSTAKEWTSSAYNESWATEKPGPQEYEDDFLLEHIYSHEMHNNKIFYARRCSSWPPECDTLKPEENVFDSKAFYDCALILSIKIK